MATNPAAQLLVSFYDATGWHQENQYSHLTLPSRTLLDFDIAPGLHLALSHRPTSLFASSLSLSTLVPTSASSSASSRASSTSPVLGPPVSPLLSGQLSYLFSSAPLPLATTKKAAFGQDRVNLKGVVQAFHPGQLPVRPELRQEALPTWLAGERVDKQDYLLFGRLYAPSPRLEALWVHRVSPTIQLLASLISVPAPLASTPLTWQPNDDTPQLPPSIARQSELLLKAQHDTGRWSTEYSYAVGDAMWGACALYNFGKSGSGVPREDSGPTSNVAVASAAAAAVDAAIGNSIGAEAEERQRVVDEEEEMSTGLKGRWSAGGEVYFSAQERSAGFSTGVRFSTLPEREPSQPPTTLTATLSPIMGQLSTAYCVGVSPDTALASRFEFNLFSYDADLTIGGEWFQRRGKGPALPSTGKNASPAAPPVWDAFGRGTPENPLAMPSQDAGAADEITGVIKARMSTKSDVALMWEGRLGSFLVSLGLVADLRLATSSGGRVSPIRSVGVGIQHWS